MTKETRLNLGSGWNGIDSWTNFDWGGLALLSKMKFLRRWLINRGWLEKTYDQSWPKIHLVDIRRKLPLKDRSVKYIYCSHVLEHFERWQAIEILKECRRVLKVGGWLRLVIPDLRKMVKKYSQNKGSPRAPDDFFREVWGFYKDRQPKNILDKLKRKFIRGHEWGYDKENLTVALTEAGFEKIRERKFRQGAVPDLESLDLEIHRWVSLYMEVQK